MGIHCCRRRSSAIIAFCLSKMEKKLLTLIVSLFSITQGVALDSMCKNMFLYQIFDLLHLKHFPLPQPTHALPTATFGSQLVVHPLPPYTVFVHRLSLALFTRKLRLLAGPPRG